MVIHRKKRLLLFLIPLAFALNPDFYKDSLRRNVFLSYIFGNLLAVILCFVRATSRSFILQDGHWTFNPQVIQEAGYDFLTSSVMDGNYFFGYEFSYFLPTPTYLGVYIVFAQYLIFEIFKTSQSKRNLPFFLGAYVFFLFALFLLSSKAAMVSSLLLTAYIAFYLIFKGTASPLTKTSILSSIILVSTIFFVFHPRFQLLKETIKSGQLINQEARFNDDIRILTWDASLELIKHHWLFGVGEGKKTSALKEVYTKKGYVFPAEQLLNSHNQFLDFLIGGGLIGFGLFIAGLIHLYVRAIKDTNYPLLAILLIFTFNELFENLLSRHAGILLFAVFISLLTTRRQ